MHNTRAGKKQITVGLRLGLNIRSASRTSSHTPRRRLSIVATAASMGETSAGPPVGTIRCHCERGAPQGAAAMFSQIGLLPFFRWLVVTCLLQLKNHIRQWPASETEGCYSDSLTVTKHTESHRHPA